MIDSLPFAAIHIAKSLKADPQTKTCQRVCLPIPQGKATRQKYYELIGNESKPAPNTRYKTLGVKWLSEQHLSHQSLVYLDSEVAPNSPTISYRHPLAIIAPLIKRHFFMEREKKMPSEILKERPELVESMIGIYKGIFGIVPHFGTMINEILFEIPNRIHQARINELVSILVNKVESLKINSIDQEYLKSDDFADFTRHLIENSLKIKSENKRTALCNIYIKSIVNKEDFEIDLSKIFMDFVIQLTPIQIDILSFAVNNQNKLKSISKYSEFYSFYCSHSLHQDLDRYEFKYYSQDLENKGLLSFGAGLEDYEDKSAIRVLESHEDPSILLTSFGLKFIDYLKSNNG